MRSLDKNSEAIILDYCLGLTSRKQAAQVKAFIACSARTAEVYACFQATLRPLASLHPEPCPDELADRTVRLLCAVAQAGR